MNQRRIYALGPPLTEEQIAVTFAKCSRSPDPFDESAQQVSEAGAADFNEKWVLGYGHSSVAEHAVAHLAVEGVSRLCADHIEDGRLSSYTEKSSRYQAIPHDAWVTPIELLDRPDLRAEYEKTMVSIMDDYELVLSKLAEAKRDEMPQREGESRQAWERRRRRESLDDARGLLPAAALTNLGLTTNARSMAYLIARLDSSPIAEDNAVAIEMKGQTSHRFPSLLRHAVATDALVEQQRRLTPEPSNRPLAATLLQYQVNPENILGSSLRFSGAAPVTSGDAEAILEAGRNLSIHDQPPREFELIRFLFSVTLDYGALREFRRHRMMTLIRRNLTALDGHDVPQSVKEAGMEEEFEGAMDRVAELHPKLLDHDAPVAQYAVCHAHRQTVWVELNLRQMRNIARLRTTPKAHAGIRLPVRMMVSEIQAIFPVLFDAALKGVVSLDAE